MRAKRKAARDELPPLFCVWNQTCHRLAERGTSFCDFHIAAAQGLARGASVPDAQTRSLFEDLYDHFDDEEDERDE